MESEVVALRFDEDKEAVARLFSRYDLIAVPVVDDRFGLLGIVTHDDALDVVQEEATEDLQRQGAVGPIEGNYLEAGFGTVWWSRAKWLAVLFLLQMLTINVMAHYEGALERVAFLMVFIPLCLSVGGNAGTPTYGWRRVDTKAQPARSRPIARTGQRRDHLTAQRRHTEATARPSRREPVDARDRPTRGLNRRRSRGGSLRSACRRRRASGGIPLRPPGAPARVSEHRRGR